MSVSAKSLGIDKLSVDERLELLGEIWDGLSAEAAALELDDEQKLELDRRLDELEAYPDRVVPWEQIKSDRGKRQVQ